MEGAMTADKNKKKKSSRLPGFYKLPLEERVDVIADWAGLDEAEKNRISGRGLAGCGKTASSHDETRTDHRISLRDPRTWRLNPVIR